ncbi:hypothetical protein JWG41_04245 [Leptospira sp. 201903075]|nr:hypothetical protein [Leptospira chreensis]MBM9589641.1 hypothetical protein [Leptospira chreensis]
MITHKDLESSARMANHFPSASSPWGIYSERVIPSPIRRFDLRGRK